MASNLKCKVIEEQAVLTLFCINTIHMGGCRVQGAGYCLHTMIVGPVMVMASCLSLVFNLPSSWD